VIQKRTPSGYSASKSEKMGQMLKRRTEISPLGGEKQKGRKISQVRNRKTQIVKGKEKKRR
jgi:hypothetical protein